MFYLFLWPSYFYRYEDVFIIYTNDFTATRDGVEIVKYADDTAIVGLISQDEFNYRYEVSNF